MICLKCRVEIPFSTTSSLCVRCEPKRSVSSRTAKLLFIVLAPPACVFGVLAAKLDDFVTQTTKETRSFEAKQADEMNQLVEENKADPLLRWRYDPAGKSAEVYRLKRNGLRDDDHLELCASIFDNSSYYDVVNSDEPSHQYPTLEAAKRGARFHCLFPNTP
jgi:hypothetical protein